MTTGAPGSGRAPILRAGLAYFALVFGAGFILGSIRVPLLVPRLGERIAEIIETPFMLVVVVVAARFIARRFALPGRTIVRLGVGGVALASMLVVEAAFIVALQHRTIGEYLTNRDPVAGAVFSAMLIVFALMPCILGWWESARERDGA